MLAGTLVRAPTDVRDLIPPALSAQLDALDVRSRKMFAGKLQGERRSKRRGRSVEFDDYRAYAPGDDLRHVDWNVLARLDRLVVKVFQEEEDLALHLVLDVSASMNAGEPNKLLVAARLAMALGYAGLVSNNRVLCTCLGAGPLARLEPARGRTGTERLGRFLLEHAFAGVSMGGAQAPTGPGFTGAVRSVVAETRGRGVIVLISDLLAPVGYEDALRVLGSASGAGACDVVVLQVLSPGELDPALEILGGGERAVIGDLRLFDAETGRTSEVTVTDELLARYRAGAARFVESARAFCAARGMIHELVVSSADVGGVLTGALRRRGVLG